MAKANPDIRFSTFHDRHWHELGKKCKSFALDDESTFADFKEAVRNLHPSRESFADMQPELELLEKSADDELELKEQLEDSEPEIGNDADDEVCNDEVIGEGEVGDEDEEQENDVLYV